MLFLPHGLLDISIAPTFGSLERDVRFVYCACAISYILNDWSGINIENTVNHIRQLQVNHVIQI
jgi:geranylgeranyl transferase type-1 subunit beta